MSGEYCWIGCRSASTTRRPVSTLRDSRKRGRGRGVFPGGGFKGAFEKGCPADQGFQKEVPLHSIELYWMLISELTVLSFSVYCDGQYG